MSQDFCFYPYHTETRKLPIYLTGIGCTDYQQPIHRPDGYGWHQFLLCTEGDGSFIHNGITRPFNAGDCIFLPAGIPHEYSPAASRWGMQWFTFDGYAVMQLLNQFNMNTPFLLCGKQNALLQSLYNRMRTELTTDRLYGIYICSALVYQFLFEFHRLTLTQTKDTNQHISCALEYINQHYHTDLSIQQLANHVGISPQHLCRIFRDIMHMSPGEHITQRRIQAAQELIQTTDYPLAEIARQSGFSSPGYFSTVFQNYVGISPSTYRKILLP